MTWAQIYSGNGHCPERRTIPAIRGASGRTATTMWVTDKADLESCTPTILSTKARDSGKDVALTSKNSHSVRGLWSDGTTMWVADNIDA